MLNKKAYTLIEIMIVATLLAMIAAFALPNYYNAILKNQERDAILQLRTLKTANEVFKSQLDAGQYNPLPSVTYNPYPTTIVSSTNPQTDIDEINKGLKINITPNGLAYTYFWGGMTFYATAALMDGATKIFEIKVDERAISSTNPCCSAGSCKIALPCP